MWDYEHANAFGHE
ncbi:Protein of unknown function [Propionibacterium freudenreichii]|uniref:Uncharacterized protein n=1 Tax=Propionibacterium freudenreichii subsp. freudenreichii TaxID=66712 RepID=A0A068VPX9_PROFF|nr:Protein of unknown function [Propionibacterium freudenreichii subsp. freudenreichii]CEG85179.1 Protein of unknown function [Propionibacterium freudenreichii]CEG89115.1 Protein of unknown function [Propionibacterium freudenreichii]CEG89411.1 Protein of unknown function [Propionibacterium freudenreichii]CEG93341.1 Protein of unknown function [Propionibacterium freudenreichii]